MPLPISRHASFTEVPIIDLGAYRDGDPAALHATAEALRRACEEVGFLYVRNHGVARDAMAGVFAASQRFFALPGEAKRAIELARSPHFRGYQMVGAAGIDPAVAISFYEAFQISAELPPDDPDVLARKPLHGANQWPAGEPAFRAAVERYYGEMKEVAIGLLRLFAIGVGLPADYFHGFYRKPLMQLRLLHYPPQDATVGDRFGVREHTDGGGFTILLQDDTGGLEVKNRAGEWIVVPPIADTFVVNIGEMMTVWTNNRFVSTPHRVINRYGRDRYSIGFFVNPDFDAVIAPLRTCIDADHPAAVESLQAGRHLYDLYRRIWPSAAPGEI